ncbi:MAG: hypothetical protein QM771_13515 [Nitrospira sp.]
MPSKKSPPFRHLSLAQEVKRLRRLEKEGRLSCAKKSASSLGSASRSKTRGRPKKEVLTQGEDGKILRIREYKIPAHAVENSHLRGKAAKAWDFINVLKERTPLVYVFLVAELRKPLRMRDSRLQIIMQEHQREHPSRRKVSTRKLLAYIMERAFDGIWEKSGITAPYSKGSHEAFYTCYVYGHRGAKQAYQRILNEPKPWPDEHVGHDLKYFLGKRGEAAQVRYPDLLAGPQPWHVLEIEEVSPSITSH